MIGVLGGGQLGQPLALAGLALAIKPLPRPITCRPAASLGELVCGDLQDPGLCHALWMVSISSPTNSRMFRSTLPAG